jgi:hypothetical protein
MRDPQCESLQVMLYGANNVDARSTAADDQERALGRSLHRCLCNVRRRVRSSDGNASGVEQEPLTGHPLHRDRRRFTGVRFDHAERSRGDEPWRAPQRLPRSTLNVNPDPAPHGSCR